MKAKFLASIPLVAGLAGCGGTWVDTDAGDCLESQIEELSKNPELFNQMGAHWCETNGKGDFAGEFRCVGSTEDGTRKMQVKCEG